METEANTQDVSDAAIAQAFRELAADPANRISCGGAIIWINIRAERLARELQQAQCPNCLNDGCHCATCNPYPGYE